MRTLKLPQFNLKEKYDEVETISHYIRSGRETLGHPSIAAPFWFLNSECHRVQSTLTSAPKTQGTPAGRSSVATCPKWSKRGCSTPTLGGKQRDPNQIKRPPHKSSRSGPGYTERRSPMICLRQTQSHISHGTSPDIPPHTRRTAKVHMWLSFLRASRRVIQKNFRNQKESRKA